MKAKKGAFIVCYQTGETFAIDINNAQEIIRINLKDNQVYTMSLATLELIGEYDNVTVELIKGGTTLSTSNGSLTLPYSFADKAEGEYTIRAYGPNYITKEIKVTIVDRIENVGSQIDIYTKEQLAKIGKGMVIFTEDIMYNGQVVANKGKWNYADNYTYRIMADIDLSSISNWQPIPDFKGKIEGNNHTISNLKIDRAGVGNTGLISRVIENGEVLDLKLRNVNVKGGTSTGGLVGAFSSAGRIKNCSVTGTITGATTGPEIYHAGGLVGVFSLGTMEDCYAESTVNGVTCVGGLIGLISSGNVKRCYANGTVNGSNSIGGFVGQDTNTELAMEISECYSNGSINGTGANAGGFIGLRWAGNIVDLENHKIINCYSKANVLTISCAGGFIGSSEFGYISNCYAKGTAQAQTSVGGFAGQVSSSRTDSKITIEKSYAMGNSTSTKKDTYNNECTGGFVGMMIFLETNATHFKINNNYAQGNAISTDNANCIGGFIGLIHVASGKTGRLELINNYSTGKPTTTASGKGGFVSTVGTDGTRIITYTNNFWDTTTSQTTTNISGTATGKTTTEMKTTSTFSSWNASIWNIVQGSYPTLKWDFTNVWKEVSGSTPILKWQES
jgi:hypothetical protein